MTLAIVFALAFVFAAVVIVGYLSPETIRSVLKPLSLDDEFDAITGYISKAADKLEAHSAKLVSRKEALEAEVAELDRKQTAAIRKHEDVDAEISRADRVKENLRNLVS